MKNIFLTLIFSLVIVLGFSQTPQIALVKPNGTTTIHSTFDAAYTASTDDDYIYLPGGTFAVIAIQKRIHIVGAGYNEDSTLVTGTTKLPYIYIYQEGAGGSIEGIKFTSNNCGNILFENSGGTLTPNSYTISNCFIKDGIKFNNSAGLIWSNVTIKNNMIGTQGCTNFGPYSISGSITNSFISNNILLNDIGGGSGLEVSNNIFFQESNLDLYGPNSTYKNNIFLSTATASTYDNVFHNNVNINPQSNQNNEVYNNVIETFSDIFINPGNTPFTYDVSNNYHIKSTSACKNSGYDGTDRGIYGGAFPWQEGSLPSNPHIYYKNVASTTNASGQLQVQYKVRTGN